MNKTAKTLCFGVLSALILFSVSFFSVIKVPKIMSAESFAAEQSLKTVVVDAGHGGIDPGPYRPKEFLKRILIFRFPNVFRIF